MPLSQPAKKRLDLHTAKSRAKGSAVRKRQSQSIHHAIRQEVASEPCEVLPLIQPSSGLMYLYQNHHEVRQKAFWSRITGIPERQFTKTHITKQPQKRTIADYPGCVRITYYDSRVASSLAIWYNAFTALVKTG